MEEEGFDRKCRTLIKGKLNFERKKMKNKAGDNFFNSAIHFYNLVDSLNSNQEIDKYVEAKMQEQRKLQ